MTNYVPYTILTISDQVNKDPLLLECFKQMFEWANREGLEGRRVYDLTLIDPNETDDRDVTNSNFFFGCKIECTDEERKNWEKRREEQISKFIADALREEK